MARPRSQPPDPLEGLTPEQLRELANRATELAGAEADVEEADTPAEEAAAEAEREEAEEALERTAERIGFTPEQTTALLDAFEERMRGATLTREQVAEAVREVMDDYTIEPEPEPEPEREEQPPPAETLGALHSEPDAPPAPPPPPDVPPEQPPAQTHWFDRPLVKKESEE